ncbi:MAG: hypothetical protein ACYCTL_01165 [Acidimicrobiales bacterium]
MLDEPSGAPGAGLDAPGAGLDAPGAGLGDELTRVGGSRPVMAPSAFPAVLVTALTVLMMAALEIDCELEGIAVCGTRAGCVEDV